MDRFLSSRIDAEKKAGNTPYIVLSTLAEMEIGLPNETEKNRLVEMFRMVDCYIDRCNRIYELITSLRSGLMQQLFI